MTRLGFYCKKHDSFKWILFCCQVQRIWRNFYSVGHLAYILYHILYLETKMMVKIQVNSLKEGCLPLSPASCIVEPMTTFVNYMYTIKFTQQFVWLGRYTSYCNFYMHGPWTSPQ
jgi:hypothetical protein